jgi:ABC-type branched-subunit amino acid transport system ATPase component
VVTVLGSNGAGKTAILKTISGILPIRRRAASFSATKT